MAQSEELQAAATAPEACGGCWTWLMRPQKRKRERQYSRLWQRPAPAWQRTPGDTEVLLSCGLSPSQVSDLLFRELTPNDYDVLLQLDQTLELSKHELTATAVEPRIETLPVVSGECCRGEECPVCLGEFEDDDSVTMLSCKHAFHNGCISAWLSRGRHVCPVCSDEVFAECGAAKAAKA
eukprot:gnl/TRDRNA2_/TRDRNA2_91132_c0_seq1.p1 gnl/TRDRNA2_/TRDRNA2_91132_c0~~gnl/TRDRNA2_/TRDRNA2_91132_c0_seq1.p1  ORF type:complete len:194 (-),score=27.37 gnl/TRDRNA2_/TRDRNA2_91132_c0_seq1:50-589(-)